MSYLTANQVRGSFLEFFSSNDHKIIHSSPLIPLNDPSLLFTNAGMVQFKNIFTGLEAIPEKPRAVSSQKCVRAGGKHNDLDNVGYTARHHTFFEMLGNFSFGDYFKEDAIKMSWDLITKTYSLDPNKLYITVYHTDEEAFKIWKKVTGFNDDKIIRIATADNFWIMGETGPCGPCSEIFYDHGESLKGGLPGSDNEGDRYIEIWNLVFMQYEQRKNGERINLPRQCIDTGLGLERLTAILQGKNDNYDIDLFRNLIEYSKSIFNVGEAGKNKNSYRIIADHLRSSSFLIADGIMPSNEGRGYVLRRIMRRAMRNIHTLGIEEPIMYKLLPQLIKEMGDAFPELKRANDLIKNTMLQEENKFQETLNRGLKLLKLETNKLGEKQALSGEVVFKLYDTYGFPVDLTADVLRMEGKEIDEEGFHFYMNEQKMKARKSWKGSGEISESNIWHEVLGKVGKTEFIHDKKNYIDSKIVQIIKDNKLVSGVKESQKNISIILDKTPFYAESGGQIGDIGALEFESVYFCVEDTKKRVGFIHEHIGNLIKGELRVGDKVRAKINNIYRKSITAHHSATHLLHKALQKKLGGHVTQKGSIVTAEKLRFDLSHSEAISEKDLREIELEVNNIIINNSTVKENFMSKDSAIELGAMALFGEKYENEVRVIQMGQASDSPENNTYSIELCGGTHVNQTGEIGLFKIISESSLASGVRRIEAVAGIEALKIFQKKDEDLSKIALITKSNSNLVVGRVEKLIKDKKELEGKFYLLKTKVEKPKERNLIIKKIGNINLFASILEETNPKELKTLVDNIKKEKKSGIIIVFSKFNNKVSIVIGITDDLVNKFNAVELIQLGVKVLGGKGGGGRPSIAQGGGPELESIGKSLEAIFNYVKKIA